MSVLNDSEERAIQHVLSEEVAARLQPVVHRVVVRVAELCDHLKDEMSVDVAISAGACAVGVLEGQRMAEADLAALRERVADLEALVRWVVAIPYSVRAHRELCRLAPNDTTKDRSILLIEWAPDGCNRKRFELADDGTGLPVLTDEARAEIRMGAQP